MKRTWLLVMIASIVASLQGCGSAKPGNSNDLVVVEQIDSVYGGREGNNYCWASFNVDVPVNGPQELVDSVMAHVNREVYLMCEYCIEHVDRPDEYVAYSEPADCLCGKSDEDNLGFTYAALDHYIRTGECDDPCVKAVIDDKHAKNLFKLKPIPHFEYKVNN